MSFALHCRSVWFCLFGNLSVIDTTDVYIVGNTLCFFMARCTYQSRHIFANFHVPSVTKLCRD